MTAPPHHLTILQKGEHVMTSSSIDSAETRDWALGYAVDALTVLSRSLPAGEAAGALLDCVRHLERLRTELGSAPPPVGLAPDTSGPAHQQREVDQMVSRILDSIPEPPQGQISPVWDTFCERVYDHTCWIGSEINNNGLDAQIRYLLAQGNTENDILGWLREATSAEPHHTTTGATSVPPAAPLASPTTTPPVPGTDATRGSTVHDSRRSPHMDSKGQKA